MKAFKVGAEVVDHKLVEEVLKVVKDLQVVVVQVPHNSRVLQEEMKKAQLEVEEMDYLEVKETVHLEVEARDHLEEAVLLAYHLESRRRPQSRHSVQTQLTTGSRYWRLTQVTVTVGKN